MLRQGVCKGWHGVVGGGGEEWIPVLMGFQAGRGNQQLEENRGGSTKESLQECSKVTGQEFLLFNQDFRKELALGAQRKRRREVGVGGGKGVGGRGEKGERRNGVGGIQVGRLQPSEHQVEKFKPVSA